MDAFPLFVGCDRSGTTMIQAVFNAHPQLAIPYESHFMVNLLRRRGRYETAAGFDSESFLADLFAFPFVERWGLTQEEISGIVEKASPTSTPEAIRAVFDLYAQRQDKPNYGDKTPGYVRYIPLIAGAFPEARFVHIIRDGRDVALSLLQMEWAPDTIVETARFWKVRVDAGRAAGAELGAGRYAELRYEDFLEDPEGETKRISSFLGLEFQESMLDYSSNAKQILQQSNVPHRHQGLLDKPTKGRRDWRTQMEERDIALFETIAGPTLTSFGYERGAPKIPAAIQAQARTQQFVRKMKGIPDRIRYELRPRLKRLPKSP